MPPEFTDGMILVLPSRRRSLNAAIVSSIRHDRTMLAFRPVPWFV
jgi:hypothetical protein